MVKELASNRTKVEVAIGGIITSLLAFLGAALIQGEFSTLEVIVPLIILFIVVWFGIQILSIIEFVLIKNDLRKDVETKTTEFVRKFEVQGSKALDQAPPKEELTWK
jgi:uncharacterized protein YacL